MRAHAPKRTSGLPLLRAAWFLILVAGCGQEMDVGSDVLWTARFELDGLEEWTSVAGGSAAAVSNQSSLDVSNERAHQGTYSAKLTVYSPDDQNRGNASLVRSGSLPVQAYYSAWYYLPRSISVGTYWVIMKFRLRTVLDDASTEGELFDVNLKNLNGGEMSLRLYDHLLNGGSDWPLDVPDPVVSVGAWFQIEAFYRAASDNSGRLTLWLDGRQILDASGPTGPTPWVAWDVVSVAESLSPSTATIYVDDCAISKVRVGPAGRIAY
jgi:hypothetical protein